MIGEKDFAERLFKEKSVALFMHVRPDGDTIGSTLALMLGLRSKGIKADTYSFDAIPDKFSFLPEIKEVKRELKEEYSALVAVDNAELSRIGDFSEVFNKHKNTYSIDHHISNTNYAKYNLVVENAANAENVLQVLKCANVDITERIAELLLTGVVTDSGNFRHKNTTERTFISAAELLKYGADVNKITYETFTKQTKERAILFARVMQKIRYFLDDKIAIITVRLKDFEETKAKQEETEGFIDFIMGINTVEVGLCVMETSKDKYKVSFRSKVADVNAVASAFGGGGHKLASGCQLNGEYEEVIERLVFETKKYIEE